MSAKTSSVGLVVGDLLKAVSADLIGMVAGNVYAAIHEWETQGG